MAIEVGDRIPSVELSQMTPTGPQPIGTDELSSSRKVVIFSVPGAFTPTCTAQHLPGFVEQSEAIKAKGVDVIACVAVNDVFVMDAWGKQAEAQGKVLMLADGNGELARELGLEMDATAFGMGLRSQRFSMLVDNGRVAILNVEAPGEFRVSSAEYLLGQL